MAFFRHFVISLLFVACIIVIIVTSSRDIYCICIFLEMMRLLTTCESFFTNTKYGIGGEIRRYGSLSRTTVSLTSICNNRHSTTASQKFPFLHREKRKGNELNSENLITWILFSLPLQCLYSFCFLVVRQVNSMLDLVFRFWCLYDDLGKINTL